MPTFISQSVHILKWVYVYICAGNGFFGTVGTIVNSHNLVKKFVISVRSRGIADKNRFKFFVFQRGKKRVDGHRSSIICTFLFDSKRYFSRETH